MPVIRQAEQRRSETPNAVMTTLASPTLGGAERSLWRIDMAPGQAGPPHTFDVEQIWTVLDGGASIELDGELLALSTGDGVVLPAAVPRRVIADPSAGLAAIATASREARALLADGTDRGVPPWIA